MLEIYNSIVSDAEREGVGHLKRLPLDDYALMLLNNTDPRLPRMPSAEAQKGWAGSSGLELLRQSIMNVRMFEGAYVRARSRSLEGRRVLDIGAGWGRLARLFLKYTDDIMCVDPWHRSIEEFKACGLSIPIELSEYVPTEFPFKGIDLAYAFSVFTHTSPRASEAILRAARKSINPDGVLVFTIRPVEFWDYAPAHKENAEALKRDHRENGYAYVQQPGNAGSSEYGDASIALDRLEAMLRETGWQLKDLDRSVIDTYQIFVVAIPA